MKRPAGHNDTDNVIPFPPRGPNVPRTPGDDGTDKPRSDQAKHPTGKGSPNNGSKAPGDSTGGDERGESGQDNAPADSQFTQALRSGWLTQGRQAQLLVSEATKLLGNRYVIPVAGGAAATHLALLALGLQANDEVILPALAPASLVTLIILAGGRPVFADVSAPEVPVLDVDDVAAHITPATRVILCDHTGGYPAAADRLAVLAAQHGLVLIEVCWRALGARLDDQPVGTFGQLATFSLQPSPDGGGFVVCADRELRQRIEQLRSSAAQPSGEGFEHDFEVTLGNGYRINEAAAATGVRLLRNLRQALDERENIVDAVRRRLGDHVRMAFSPAYSANARPSYAVLPILLDSPAQRLEAMRRARSAHVGLAVPTPTYRLPPHNARVPRLYLPQTEAYCAQAIELEVSPELITLSFD